MEIMQPDERTTKKKSVTRKQCNMKKAQREKSEIWRKKSTQMDNGPSVDGFLYTGLARQGTFNNYVTEKIIIF